VNKFTIVASRIPDTIVAFGQKRHTIIVFFDFLHPPGFIYNHLMAEICLHSQVESLASWTRLHFRAQDTTQGRICERDTT
jgi:hypothetical protein